jgi:hypothetical protein
MFMFVSVACAQTVIQPWEVPCNQEKVHANLELNRRTHILGELKDASGAPFELSKVELKKLGRKDKFVSYKAVITDRAGDFDFGAVDPGKYRFLPSSSRAFNQPTRVDCFENESCELKVILKASPTDQEFSGCPIQ